MVNDTLPDLTRTYTISATQGERTRTVSMAADEWNIMALVNGQNSLDEICRLAGRDRQTTLKRLAQLKLAGLITPIEKKERPAGELEKMVNNLTNLLESYLTDRTRSRLSPADLTTETVGENN
jgi:hypothetical protein